MHYKNITTPKTVKLPSYAKRYITERKLDHRRRSLINHFHLWLQNQRVKISTLRQSHVDNFLQNPSLMRAAIKPTSQKTHRKKLRVYLYWLKEQQKINFDPAANIKRFHYPNAKAQMKLRHLKPLSPEALQFIDSLKPTLRANTWKSCRGPLRRFHEFLKNENISLAETNRTHISKWLQQMYQLGLHPATRIQHIFTVKRYLWWLYDQNLIQYNPDDLLRKSDIPKLPNYLPRPLPPEVDLKLQNHLSESTNQYCQGLLLMRRTGLRIGELINLPYNCVHRDHQKNEYLKVPLGKLYTERMVPLDTRTSEIIKNIKFQGKQERNWLLETDERQQTRLSKYQPILKSFANKMQIKEPITSHRLRHSYATSMINAGMSLVGVMKLLGHKDFRMTMRYAAITQESIGKEYFSALKEIETRYSLPKSHTQDQFTPQIALDDIAKWLNKTLRQDKTAKRRNLRLQKKIHRLKKEILLLH